MKKIFLILLLVIITGCDSEVIEVKDPNGSSLTYKYFDKENYQPNKYNIKLKSNNSTILIKQKENNLYYEIKGDMNLIIIEKNGMRYTFDSVNKVYSTQSIITSQNYIEGILPPDMNKLKNQSYKTGKEKINSHKYTFETYKYNGGKTTYYFDDEELKFIKKKTDTENLTYEALKFSSKVKDDSFKIPKGYMEMTY